MIISIIRFSQNMKNSILLGVIVVIVLGSLYFWRAGVENNVSNTNIQNATSTVESKTETVNSVPKSTSPKTTNVSGMKVSLGGIFAEAGSHQCDYEQITQTSRSSNVLYFYGGKMRGEFRTTTGEKGTNTIMVYDGQYLYTWTEGMSTGIRSQPKTLKDLPSIIPEDITSGRILGAGINNVSWNCHAWNRDNSKLAVPSYVKFY